MWGLSSRCQQGCILFWRPSGRIGFLAFGVSRGCHIPWLLASSSIFKASGAASPSDHSSLVTSPWTTAGKASPLLRIHVHTWIIQNNLPVSRFFTFITSAKSLLPWTSSQVLRLGGECLWRSLFRLPQDDRGTYHSSWWTFNYCRSILFIYFHLDTVAFLQELLACGTHLIPLNVEVITLKETCTSKPALFRCVPRTSLIRASSVNQVSSSDLILTGLPLYAEEAGKWNSVLEPSIQHPPVAQPASTCWNTFIWWNGTNFFGIHIIFQGYPNMKEEAFI